jgi:peptide/nickel transport system permease protein
MPHAIIKRMLQLIPVLLGIATIVFFLQRLIPGSPADVVLGPDAPDAQKQEWLAQFGFDAPLWQQYGHFLWNLLQGDLGRSFMDHRPVVEVIAPRLGVTFSLALAAFCFSLVVSTLVGVYSASRAGQLPDKLAAVVSLLAVSAPTFIIGPLSLWIFSVKLGWLPLLGHEGFLSYVLPTITLGSALAAFTSRMIRSGIVDVLGEDYIRTAYSKGLSRNQVLWRHALRNAFLPALTVLGMQLGVLLSGTVITEQIFSWPGLGSLTIEAVQAREYNIVSGCVLVMAVVFVLSNFLVDLLYQVFDPRVRQS